MRERILLGLKVGKPAPEYKLSASLALGQQDWISTEDSAAAICECSRESELVQIVQPLVEELKGCDRGAKKSIARGNHLISNGIWSGEDANFSRIQTSTECHCALVVERR